ncbi:MAG: hypothetical protein KDK23_08130 [Leptospiraceae bacterium]|nr:hypothetical protein [Leptospiraceae bacterium]
MALPGASLPARYVLPGLLSLAILPNLACTSGPEIVRFEKKGYAKLETGLYVHESPPFSILFPEKWEILPGTNTYIRSVSPYINPQDNFRESIGLQFFDIDQDVTLAEIYEANKVSVQKLKRHRVEEEGTSFINDHPANTIRISYDLRQGLRLETLFLVGILETEAGNRGIILSGTALQKDMQTYESIFIDSFSTLRTGPPQDDSRDEPGIGL